MITRVCRNSSASNALSRGCRRAPLCRNRPLLGLRISLQFKGHFTATFVAPRRCGTHLHDECIYNAYDDASLTCSGAPGLHPGGTLRQWVRTAGESLVKMFSCPLTHQCPVMAVSRCNSTHVLQPSTVPFLYKRPSGITAPAALQLVFAAHMHGCRRCRSM